MSPPGEPPRDLPDRVIRAGLRHAANLRAFLRREIGVGVSVLLPLEQGRPSHDDFTIIWSTSYIEYVGWPIQCSMATICRICSAVAKLAMPSS